MSHVQLVCRLCMVPVSQQAPNIHSRFCSIIKSCLNIRIDNDDGLPKKICNECSAKLEDYNEFKTNCQQIQTILLQRLKSNGNDETTKESVENVGKKTDVDADAEAETETETETNAMSDDDENELTEDDKTEQYEEDHLFGSTSFAVLPELAEPSPDDYVLMKEETFNIDPTNEDINVSSHGVSSSILADYLIEFNNCGGKTDDAFAGFMHNIEADCSSRDKDIVDSQKLRREVLPPMWDVYEKTIFEKQNPVSDGGESWTERRVRVTQRRYIVKKSAFPCSLCGACFEFDQGKRRDDFTCDQQPPNNNKLYDCFVCSQMFPTRAAWKRHQTTHQHLQPYLCRVCKKGFNWKEELRKHLLWHSRSQQINCDVCAKTFAHRELLVSHQVSSPACAAAVSSADTSLRPFGCELCPQFFLRREHLLRHRKRTHDLAENENSEVKPFTCFTCSKTFSRREHLKRHQIIHQNDFTNVHLPAADAVAESIPDVSILPSFLPEITLSEVQPVDSNHSVFDSSSLSNHNGINGEDMVENMDDTLPPIPVLEMNADTINTSSFSMLENKRSTFCNVCLKNFSRRSHLLRHMKRIHCVQLPSTRRRATGAKKFGDENGNLLPHNEIHKCLICKRTFSRRSHLERHERNIHHLNKDKRSVLA